jgi:toxin ParE1/3/4
MAAYSLNLLAEQDVRRIYRYGIETFGLDKADSYFDALFAQFDAIAQSPLMYPTANYIRQGYRRCVFGVNAIYYRLSEDGVQIMRVLGRENPDIWL